MQGLGMACCPPTAYCTSAATHNLLLLLLCAQHHGALSQTGVVALAACERAQLVERQAACVRDVAHTMAGEERALLGASRLYSRLPAPKFPTARLLRAWYLTGSPRGDRARPAARRTGRALDQLKRRGCVALICDAGNEQRCSSREVVNDCAPHTGPLLRQAGPAAAVLPLE
jgi:hypothetical protein